MKESFYVTQRESVFCPNADEAVFILRKETNEKILLCVYSEFGHVRDQNGKLIPQRFCRKTGEPCSLQREINDSVKNVLKK